MNLKQSIERDLMEVESKWIAVLTMLAALVFIVIAILLALLALIVVIAVGGNAIAAVFDVTGPEVLAVLLVLPVPLAVLWVLYRWWRNARGGTR